LRTIRSAIAITSRPKLDQARPSAVRIVAVLPQVCSHFNLPPIARVHADEKAAALV
jgi:hypothetical protein